jgi:hypothetical protein
MKLFQYVNHLSPVTGLASGSTYQIPRLDLPITRINDTIFVPLPVELWRARPGGCSCQFCKADGSHGYWDALALSAVGGNRHQDRTYTVHHPALHAPHIRKQMAARGSASHPYNDLAGNSFCFVCGLEEAHSEANHPASQADRTNSGSQTSSK